MSLASSKIAPFHLSCLIICLVSICLINISSATSLFTNDILDDITDPVTVRFRARSPKTSKPVSSTDSPLFNDVTGPIDTFVASTIRSNTRTVTPSAVASSSTATASSTSTTTTTTTTTAAPTTTASTTTTSTTASPRTSTSTTSRPSVRVAASTTVASSTKATPVRRIATHPPWPGETTTKARATHAPWNPEELHRPRGSSKHSSGNRNRATHAPYTSGMGGMNHYGDTSGGGFGYSSSQSEHLFPTKSNYAPYVYGSDAKKKSILSILGRESINSWAKDFISYLTHPFASGTGATSTSSSSESTDSMIARVLKTLKAALNKRSGEERNGGVDELSNDNILFKLKNASWIKRLQNTPSSSNYNSYNKNDKRFRDVALTTLVDFFRFKRHRTQAADAMNLKADGKHLSSPDAPCIPTATNKCHA